MTARPKHVAAYVTIPANSIFLPLSNKWRFPAAEQSLTFTVWDNGSITANVTEIDISGM